MKRLIVRTIDILTIIGAIVVGIAIYETLFVAVGAEDAENRD